METNKTEPVQPPKPDQNITNTDDSHKLPDANPDPLDGNQTDVFDPEYEGREEAGNVGAETEWDAEQLDGSNANNIRTK